jgi:hypothetical protein
MRTKRVASRLNLVVVAAAAGGLLWIEHAQRIRIDLPPPAEIAARDGAICPENESVPFSPDCMTFIQGAAGPALRTPVGAPAATSADSPELP